MNAYMARLFSQAIMSNVLHRSRN